jgi:hypothetical protein
MGGACNILGIQDYPVPMSVCFEAEGYNTVSVGKGGINYANGGVVWYLPTVKDYVIAFAHGITRVAWRDSHPYWVISSIRASSEIYVYALFSEAAATNSVTDRDGDGWGVKCTAAAP